MNKADIHPILLKLIPIAEGIVKTLGESCEVVIHDLKNPESSLVYIAGNVTGRKLGAPLTNLSLEILKQKGKNAHDLIGYETTTKDGKTLKSSTMFVRDDNEEVIGCMCINYEISHILTCIKILESFTKINISGHETKESFYYDVNEAMEEIVNGVLKEYHIPITLMEKEHKVQVVKALEDKGVFLVKGAIEYVANILSVSRYTIYNYLDEVRSNTGSNKINRI
ncbi:MAG: PAS domain-containing protein [Dehalobacterium sp.]